MINGIGNLFPPKGELNVSYDFIDLASGTGYVTYDGVNAIATSETDKYILIDSSLASTFAGAGDFPSDLKFCYNTPNHADDLDMDFNLSEFKVPRTIKGLVIVKGVILGETGATWGVPVTAYVRKWDGSTETEIANGTVTVTNPNAVSRSKPFVIAIEVSETKFKIGETLRITIVTTKDNNTSFAHNPSNSAITAGTNTVAGVAGSTRFTVSIPYKITVL